MSNIDDALRHIEVTPYSITTSLAGAIYARCSKELPKRILDVGSGLSTMALALYASEHDDVQLLSVEHDAQWYAKTDRALRKADLRDHVVLELAPLRSFDRGRYVWYDLDPVAVIGAPFDFVFVDGPPASHAPGRHGALWRAPEAVRSSVVWLHDGRRSFERAAVEAWKTTHAIEARLSMDHDERGVWEIEVR